MENKGMNAGTGAYDRIFRAIGDPHRVQILELLRENELSAGEILEAIDVVQSTLSHHMKTLVDSGVVNASRRGKWTYYSLNSDTLSNAADFLADFAQGTKILSDHNKRNDIEEKEIIKEVKAIKEDVKEIKEEAKVTEPSAATKKNAGRKVKDKGLLLKETAALDETEVKETVDKSEKSEKKKSKKGKKNKKNKK